MLADAPWITRAEREGCDYMYEFLGLLPDEEDEEEEDDEEEQSD